MRKYYFILISTALLGIVLFVLHKNQNPANTKDHTVGYQSLLSDYIETYRYLDRPIDSDSKLYDIDGNTTTIEEIYKGSSIMCFRFSKRHCQSCIDILLPEIEKLSQKIGHENIIFLASHYNTRDLNAFKSLNKIKNPIYNIDTIQLKAEDLYNPYTFILDNDCMTKLFFIPRKESLEIFSRYLKEINEYLTVSIK